MTTQTKIIVALAVTLAASIAISTVWSNLRIAELERRAEDAIINADKLEYEAIESEKRADEYKQKLEYLESQADAIRSQARRQDEKLEKAATNVRDARRNVERVRGTRHTESDEQQLCDQLAAVGHGCQ